MKHYGLLGTPLSHSYSATFFANKFAVEGIQAQYTLWDMQKEAIPDLLKREDIHGINVTSPYKEVIIPYLDTLDDTAQKIGSVNCLVRYHNRSKQTWRGYNTDWIGFTHAIQPIVTQLKIRQEKGRAMILGTGGVAKAIAYALTQMEIPYIIVSHTGKGNLSYGEITRDIVQRHALLVQCTPLGMHPNTEEAPEFPYQWITAQHVAFDCIYNPHETIFLRNCKRAGATIENGLTMLQEQAKEAWRLWNTTIEK